MTISREKPIALNSGDGDTPCSRCWAKDDVGDNRWLLHTALPPKSLYVSFVALHFQHIVEEVQLGNENNSLYHIQSPLHCCSKALIPKLLPLASIRNFSLVGLDLWSELPLLSTFVEVLDLCAEIPRMSAFVELAAEDPR